MPFADVGDAEIHYGVRGEGEPLFLVAGLGGAASYWRANLDAFAARHRVVVHDQRGTGASTRSDICYSVAQMADDLIRLMDHLRVESADIVGHSTGAAIGQELAIEHPERVRSLVLYGSWIRPNAWMRRIHILRRDIALTQGMAAYRRATPLFLYPSWWIDGNDALLAEREQDGLSQLPPPTIAASRIDAVLAFERSGDLHRIAAPTLVLCARDDALTPLGLSEELARAIEGSTLEVMERGGHACSDACPEEFARRVLGFLEAQRAREGGTCDPSPRPP